MITYWIQENGLFTKIKKDKISEVTGRLWIDARNVTQQEIAVLQQEYNIDMEILLDVIDPDELSRIEKCDGYNLAIMRLPVFTPNTEPGYTTAPVGSLIFPDKIITVCWTDCEVLRDLSANRIKDLSLTDFPAFIIRIMARADIMFLRYLKEINRRITSIQTELQESIENSELIQLLNLEKSLTYFTTSLKANQLLLEKIRRTKILKLDDDDQEWLDDVEVDNRQAMEMADTYSTITAGTMDAFASVISNNMNMVMKKLTDISIVLAMMSFIASFWGMNIQLPWSREATWTGVICVTGLCALTTTTYLTLTFFLNKKRRHTEKMRKKKK